VIGAVSELWRFPVKSMRGERLDQAELTEHGLLGDRAYGLIETDTGKVVSAKSVQRFPGLLHCRASFVEPPIATRELPPVRIELPDGSSVTSDACNVDARLSAHFGHAVTLARAAPHDFTIDQYQPDLEATGGTIIQQKLGAALFDAAGLPSPLPHGAFLDVFPLSLLTTATLKRLNALRPASRFDARRFRMNVIVETPAIGFVENDWVGREITVGTAVRCRIMLPDPRCVMTTLAQDELPDDVEILRTLTTHNRIEVGAFGKLPCAGVYAVVATGGTVRTGDAVAVT
jgi:MOSC domain-containing protein